MVIKNVEIIHTDPAIIEVTYHPYPQKIIDSVYKEKGVFQQLKFDNLVVEDGRTFYSAKRRSVNHSTISNYFLKSFERITLELLKLDPIRFPIMFLADEHKEKALKSWYMSNSLKKHQSLLMSLDRKGFHQGTHLDNRFAMWAGIINLQDNKTGTHHYKNEFDDDPYFVASGEQFKGTFWLNTEKTWHGVPKLDENRRVLVCNQMYISTTASVYL